MAVKCENKMVDVFSSSAEQMNNLHIHEDCPIALVEALINFKKNAKSHTTTSRRYSIWSLCKKEVEPTIIEVLGKDVFCLIAPDGFSEGVKTNATQLEDRIRMILARNFANQNFRDKKTIQRNLILETLISLVHFCKNCRSSKYAERYGPKKGMRIPRRGLDHYPFCELCEELCEVEEMKVKEAKGDKRLPEYDEGTEPSFRFCITHRPGSAGYRRDHNYRDTFHNKIKELGHALGKKSNTTGIEKLKKLLEERYYCDEDFISKIFTANEVESKIIVGKDKELRSHLKYYPDSYSEFDAIIRYVAYYIVHLKKGNTRRKILSRGESPTLKKIRESRANGKNIAEAAREAGVSRQAAWKALKEAEDI